MGVKVLSGKEIGVIIQINGLTGLKTECIMSISKTEHFGCQSTISLISSRISIFVESLRSQNGL